MEIFSTLRKKRVIFTTFLEFSAVLLLFLFSCFYSILSLHGTIRMFSQDNIILKTSIDVLHIKKSCEVVSFVLNNIGELICEGSSLLDIDRHCAYLIEKKGAVSAVKGFKGFPGYVCVSVNNVAAHGIPSDYTLQNGDIITVDCAVLKNGWHGDGAVTFGVGEISFQAQRLLNAAKNASIAGIKKVKAGNRLGDIGHAVQKLCKSQGIQVFQNFVGHGIGRDIHEDPKIYHFGEKGVGQPIVPGMVFTIEPILSLGSIQTKTLEDKWSLVTIDNSLTAQFEFTLAVFGDRTEILTTPDLIEKNPIFF